MKEFCMSCDKESLIKVAARSRTDSFDFHRMALTSIKILFKRLKSSVMKDRDYYSSKDLFWEELLNELWKVMSEKNAHSVEEFTEIS